MADVSTLGLAVDSSGVRRATDDLGKFASAGGKAEASTRDYEAAVKQATASGASFGLAIGAGITAVGALTAGVLKLASAAGDYQDIAEKTGGSASGFAAFRTAADVAGTSVTSVADASVRLSVALSKVDDESRGAGKALQAIGLSVTEFKAQSPDQQIATVAKALSGFQDGAGKAAVAVALFGRAGADLLPFLKEYGQQTERNVFLTDEQIATADDFSDAAKRNRSEISQLAQALATETLPYVNAFLGAVKDTAAEMAGVTGASKTLGAETGVRDFAEGAAKALGGAIDVADGFIRVVIGVNKALGASAAAAVATAEGNFAGAQSVMHDLGDELDALAQREQFSAKLARQLEQAKNASSIDFGKGDGWDQKKVVDFSNSVGKVTDEYAKLIERIRERTAVEQAEADAGEKLLPAQREAITLAVRLQQGTLQLSDAKVASIDAELKVELAVQRSIALREAEKKALEALNQAQATALDAGYQQVAQARAGADLATDQLALYGKSRDELDALASSRLRDAAAQLEWKAQFNGNSEFLEKQSEQYRQQAAALRETADLKDRIAARQRADATDPLAGAQRGVDEYLDSVRRAGDATATAVSGALHGLEDATVAILSGHGGKDAARKWVDEIIAEVIRLKVVQPLIASIFGGGSGGGINWAGLIGTVASYASGSYDSNYSHEGLNYPAPSGKQSMNTAALENKSGGSDASARAGTASGAMPSIQIINQTSEKIGDAKANRLPDGTIQLVLKAAVSAAAASVKSGGEMHEAIAGAYQLNRAGSAPRY